MKKITCFVFILFCTFKAFSQGASAFTLDIGAKVGVNLNQVQGDYWDNGYKANLLAGAYISLNTRRWGVQIEPLFTQSTFHTGAGFRDLYKDFYRTGKDSVTNGTFRINYWNVPVLLNLKLMSRVWLQIGPQFSGTISVKDNDKLMQDAETFFKNSMVSGVGGLQINLPANLTLSGRYVMGLNNLNGNSNYIQYNQNVKDTWNQRMVQIALGYTFF